MEKYSSFIGSTSINEVIRGVGGGWFCGAPNKRIFHLCLWSQRIFHLRILSDSKTQVTEMPFSCTLCGEGTVKEEVWKEILNLRHLSGRPWKLNCCMKMCSFTKCLLTCLQGCLFPILKPFVPNHSTGWICL